MTFKELINELFGDNQDYIINPCESFDCEFDCKKCIYNKTVDIAEKFYENNKKV